MAETSVPAGGESDSRVRDRRFLKQRSKQVLSRFEGLAPEAEVLSYLGSADEQLRTSQIKYAWRALRQLKEGKTWQEIKESPAPKLAHHKADAEPRDSRFHDILLVRKSTDEDGDAPEKRFRYDRFRVIKEGPGRGGYLGSKGEPLSEVGVEQEGYRAVINLATTGVGSAEERGPLLSALPLNPDPAASSSCTCYLLNPGNLNYVTAWTAEEWSDRPGDEGPPLDVEDDSFNLLIATPGGKVYYLEKKGNEELKKENVVDSNQVVFREVALGKEPEIWSQLRNGCVVGRAKYSGTNGVRNGSKVTPLVNIHSLLPSPTADSSK